MESVVIKDLYYMEMVPVNCVPYIHIQIKNKKVAQFLVLSDNSLIKKEYAKIAQISRFLSQPEEAVKQ